MKIKLIQTGKTHIKFTDNGFAEYQKRIEHYCKFEYEEIVLQSKLKTENIELIKKNESEAQLKRISSRDFLILLDNRGKEMDSEALADFIQKTSVQNSSFIFLIGGAFGFSDDIYSRANYSVSLSKFTFSHQLVKLIFAEQLYRAFTIINNIPYHH